MCSPVAKVEVIVDVAQRRGCSSGYGICSSKLHRDWLECWYEIVDLKLVSSSNWTPCVAVQEDFENQKGGKTDTESKKGLTSVGNFHHSPSSPSNMS